MHCILVSCFAELGSSCSSLFQTFAFWKGLSVLFVFVQKKNFHFEPPRPGCKSDVERFLFETAFRWTKFARFADRC